MIYSNCQDFTLEKDGIQVIENVLTSQEICDLRNKMWKWLNFKTKYLSKPVVRKDPTTWKSLFELFPKHGMLFQHWDFGHNPLSWTIRQNEKVIDKFREIWNTDKLLTSFDGISISLPCEITNRGWYLGKDWFHTDQSFTRNGFECVQGFVNLYDVNEGDATLRVLRGSHKLHKVCREKFQIENPSDWYKLTSEQTHFYIDKLGQNCDICVKTNAGSLVLWDSRTIHQGMQPQKERKKLNIRCVLYVCMTPASLASQKILKNRIKYFKARKTCNHWPHKTKPFPKIPRTYGKPIPKVENENIEETTLMRKLVGYNYLT